MAQVFSGKSCFAGVRCSASRLSKFMLCPVNSDSRFTELKMPHLKACHCCGMIHAIPELASGNVAACTRCESVIVFVLCVALSMVASMSFDPHAIWADDDQLDDSLVEEAEPS